MVKIAKQRSLGSSGIELTYSSSILEDTLSPDDVTETTPMLSPVAEEPVASTSSAYQTEVAVEVHRNPNGTTPGSNDPASTNRAPDHLLVPRSGKARLAHTKRSISVDTGYLHVRAISDRKELRDKIRTKSYDVAERETHGIGIGLRRTGRAQGSAADYNRLAITQFNRGPFYSADYDLISEGGSPELRPKVRYNDTGSVEEVNEDHQPVLLDEIVVDDMNFDESDSDTVNGAHKYRQLWDLRATLEEEENFSDTVRMDDRDMTSPDEQSTEEREVVTTSHTTSFESNTEPVSKTEPSRSDQEDSSDETVIRRSADDSTGLQPPRSENRRQTYRSILTKRLKRIEAPTASTENSFDSVETMETDGDISDTSRQDMTTTSFESTTDNTDSTGEGNSHRLQQMRGDSGYKSLEAQQSSSGGPLGKPLKKQIHFVLDHETSTEREGHRLSPTPSPEDPSNQSTGHSELFPPGDNLSAKRSVKSSKTHFERRNGKTASKKRREYRSERQVIQVYESVNEPETDSRSDHGPSGDSFDESPRKLSLFSRFLKSHSKESKRSPPIIRDFSMDEQTNALFNEFVRYDPTMDHKQPLAVRRTSTRIRNLNRLHRKHSTDTGSMDIVSTRRRERLAPSMRSASLGSDSSLGSGIRRLSPQDSIEEELPHRDSTRWQEETPSLSNKVIKDIPIIRLPEEDSNV